MTGDRVILDCYKGRGVFRCDECSFAIPEGLVCANPNIWNGSPDEAYHVPKGMELTEEEIFWVEKLL